MNKPTFLFEVSWEVCNKVGGIYTVLYSKLKQVANNYGNNYILIGPWYENNKGFVEADSDFFASIRKVLLAKNIVGKVGYWDTVGKPTVILVDFKHRHNIDVLLYNLWTDFGIDSFASNYDYQEPILFSTTAGEVICALADDLLTSNYRVVAHFHEWMCGAGLLYLKKHANDIATVFTTHATVLGRALSHANKFIYDLPANFDIAKAAHEYGVFAKHSLELASAREADCFTTVSNVTADEADVVLGKYPDKIVYNGFEVLANRPEMLPESIRATRAKLLQIASKVAGKEISQQALLWVTSGRYEFHNKGYDLLLRALAQLESTLPENSPPIVMFYLVAVAWHNRSDSLFELNLDEHPEQRIALGIATHRLYNPADDSIIKLCNELNFRQPERKIHVVFCDAYLHGDDGVFDIPYEQILAACDLSIFPSFYEPWGYTPLESIAFAVPTITTDLAGFGNWIDHIKQDVAAAVYVLPRKNNLETRAIADLAERLKLLIQSLQDVTKVTSMKVRSLQLAELADWRNFYQNYLEAYSQALKFNELSHAKDGISDAVSKNITVIYEAESIIPRLRSLQFESLLPNQISGLRDLAYNFWWSWHEDAKLLFQKIDQELWERVRHNPVHFLNLVSAQSLQYVATDEDYLWFYKQVMHDFNDYILVDKKVIKFCSTTAVSTTTPIAYFCMEYGIDECLPIYSGGLGILAGDYLKAISDLKVPMVAVGLFYHQGYFHQKVNSEGEQEALYETWDPNQIPMQRVNDELGKAILACVDILGRTVYIRGWQVKVGQVNLYLLDTDVPENSEADRKITNSLYGGSAENRLLQEIVLGVGGVRFLVEKLNIKPSLYHLNEGHSAFLLLERIRNYCHQGFTFAEASELVRCSSVFTTHTPVPAGNETFSEAVIRKYFTNYVASFGISIDKILNMANDNSTIEKEFSMTALALRLTLNANAVSTLHGKVARAMWQGIWSGLLENEVPIEAITNGIHLATWLGNNMSLLYEDYVPNGWMQTQEHDNVIAKIRAIPNAEIWKAHQTQKGKLLSAVKQLIMRQYTLRNENKQLLNSSLKCLTSETLLIGLSRRFTGYKRNDLFLLDVARLAKILTDEKRPVVILIAGKAHPADGIGKDLIRGIIATLRNEVFAGHIIFLEEYNIGLAKLLVQGVDVWLNTPILGREACGTSGMKVGVNGGLNFSTRDGWWDEAFSQNIGWQVESLTEIEDMSKRDDMENMFLLDTLEHEIVPLYYNVNRAKFNPQWVEKMKASIGLTISQYNTHRMARDYVSNMYCPTVLQSEQLQKNSYADLRSIVNWKNNIVDKFNTVKIKAIFIDGIKNGKIAAAGMLKVKLLLFSGKMQAHELKAEFVVVLTDGYKMIAEPIVIPLIRVDSADSGVLTYVAEYQISDTGFYSYGVRVLPYNGALYRQQDAGVVYWG